MVVRTLLIAALLTLAGESCLAQAETERSYLRPGTAEVGGISDLCLIYHGRQARVPWTKEALMPYVAHVDEQGTPQDWMFDSFLFIEFATDGGAMLHYYAKDKVQATAADWVWLADCWFREETGLIGLEQAVAAAGQALGDADHTVGVVITVPKPLAEIASFGPLAGETDTLDLSREESGQKVLAWYIERVLAQWGEHEYPHLRLLGFYWLAEGIGQGEHDLVKWTAEHVHERGYRLYWIPYFGAGGLQEWRNLGIDATMLQPNYFFHENATLYRFLATTKRALKAGSGIEIEFDGRALTDDTFRDKFYAYLDA